MKRKLLIIILIVTSFTIHPKAGNRYLSDKPECTVQADRYTLYYPGKGNDTSSVKALKGPGPFMEGNNDLKGKLKRLDRKYHQYLSGDKSEFKGHLALFEMGINSFARPDYSGYSVPDFMNLNQFKSLEINLRLFRFSGGLQQIKNNIGVVSGLELTLNNYRFSRPYTLVNEENHTNPVPLNTDGLSKTKLTTAFLTVPLLFECQFPSKKPEGRFFISGGLVGGLRLGSHTKVVQFGDKIKIHNDFNLNPFRYGATLRLGYKDITFFTTYYTTPLFKQGRGPEMYPFTIGIGIINK